MLPEYATNGHYSLKSDVLSFGVIVLGIVSRKRNRGYRNAAGRHLDLLGHPLGLEIESCIIRASSSLMILRQPHSQHKKLDSITIMIFLAYSFAFQIMCSSYS